MKYIVGAVFTEAELVALGLYLLTCTVAVVIIVLYIVKITINLIKKNPLNKFHLLYIGLGILTLFLANVLIEL